MIETSTNGIRTLWEEAEGPYTGALVFGVGRRNESFLTLGVTHLVEHLVMSSLSRTTLETNAWVDAQSTVFIASGDPGEVSVFLAEVCNALTSVPLERLELEARILDVEGEHSSHPLSWVSHLHFGNTGLGLQGAEGRSNTHLTAHSVTSHARVWFTQGNAVLVCSGKPPHNPDIRLPENTAGLPSSHSVRNGFKLPAMVGGRPYVCLGAIAPRDVISGVFFRVLVERIEAEARHARGLIYAVDWDSHTVDRDQSITAIWCDAAEADHAIVAAIMTNILRDLAADGPTVEELDFQRERARQQLADARGNFDRLVENAIRLVHGDPPITSDGTLEELARTSVAEVQRRAQAVSAALMVGLSDATLATLQGIRDASDETLGPGIEVPGRTFRRKLLVAAFGLRDLEVTIGPEGVHQRLEGQVVGGPWGDVVGVATDKNTRLVTFRNGDGFYLFADALKNGSQALALIDQYGADVSYPQADLFPI